MKKFDIKKLNKRFWKKITVNGLKIYCYFIDGDYVRENGYSEFFLGGHHFATGLSFILHDEWWFEKVEKFLLDRNFFHEKSEFYLMKFCGYTYKSAHRIITREQNEIFKLNYKKQELNIKGYRFKNKDLREFYAKETGISE
jgi:hypothetical protein